MLWPLGLFFPFDCLIEDDMLLTTFFFISSILHKSSINCKANWSPLSLKTFFGIPCIFHILSQQILAIFSNNTIIVVALSLIIFVKWFTITIITSLLFDFGSNSIISILISYHGPWGVSNGWSSPTFFMCCTLFCWYFWCPWTYSLMLFHIPSYQ